VKLVEAPHDANQSISEPKTESVSRRRFFSSFRGRAETPQRTECQAEGNWLRVRFSKGFRAGHEEWSAEVEGLIKGELQIFTRYRGPEAAALHALLSGQANKTVTVIRETEPVLCGAVAAPTTNTVHDLKLP
jgi:hypothetical protein